MSEAEVVKYFIQFGSTGLLAWVMWSISNRYMKAHQDQVAINQEQQLKRIEAVEEHTKLCEEDRKLLREQLISILTHNGK